MNLREVTMKYGRLVVFICHDSAEIWGFRYGLTLVIGTLKKIMASNGVFERIILRRNQTYFYGPISESGPIIGPYFQRTSAKLWRTRKRDLQRCMVTGQVNSK